MLTMSNRRGSFSFLIPVALILLSTMVAVSTARFHHLTFWNDDTIGVYALLLKFPDRFQHDVISYYGYGSLWGTIINWGPALLWRELNLPILPMYVVIDYIDGITIGLAAFLLVDEVTQNGNLGLLAIPFVYAIRPIQWNLTNSKPIFPLAYAADLAFYICVIAFVFLLQKRKWLALVLLLIAGLVHPAITLYACAVVGLYLLWTLWRTRDLKTVWFLTGLAFVGAITVIPRFLIKSAPLAPVPLPDIIDAFRANDNFFPYLFYFSRGLNTQFTGFILWCILVWLSTAYWKQLSLAFRQLLVISIVASILLYGSQIFGTMANILALIQLVGGRTAQFFVILSVPMLFVYGWSVLKRRDWLATVLIVIALLLLVIDPNYGLIATTWNFLFYELSCGRFGLIRLKMLEPTRKSHRLAAKLVRGLSLLSALLLLIFRIEVVIDPHTVIPVIGTIVLAGLLLITDIKLPNLADLSRPAVALLLVTGVVFAVSALDYLNQQAAFYLTPQIQALYQVQQWASEYTPPNILFAGIEQGWRAETQRAYFPLYFLDAFVYVLDPRLLAYQDRAARYYGATFRNMELVDYAKAYYAFTADDFEHMQRIEKFDLLIYETKKGKLPFPIAYQNDYYTIYDFRTSRLELTF